MLCEECGQNEAVFTVTVTSGDEVTTRHLCGDCIKKMEISLSQGDIQSFLTSILSVLSSATTDTSPVCGGCGMHYSQFEKTGRLGCAQCYRDFSEQLKPLLQRIHGCTQHAGHAPKSQERPAGGSCDADARRDELRQKMDEAVASENFEDAAKYRDELRALNEEGEIAP